MGITLENISKSFGRHCILDNLNLTVGEGEFHVILGPSGEGKSTLLALVAGLLQPDGGKIFIAGQEVNRVPTQKRGIGFVFQDYALFPNLTSFENVAYGLRTGSLKKEEIQTRVDRYLELVGLADHRDKYPDMLSGGQKQRVALARALATEPRVLLLDEPLSNLDACLQEQLRADLRIIQQKTGVTTLYVTHNRTDAMALADRVSILHQGRIERSGSLEDIFYEPETQFVAVFLGVTNILNARLSSINDNSAEVCIVHPGLKQNLKMKVKKYPVFHQKKEFSLCIHPEKIKLCEGPETDNSFLGRIVRIGIADETLEVIVDISGIKLKAVLPKTSVVPFEKAVWICFRSDAPHPVCESCNRHPDYVRDCECRISGK
jgi:ABC-type Fe3+/spermidine/putrescine transport system ATPase subunit